ncbi:MAG: cytochrome c biogenesis protein CcsA [Phycisphaerales bacterium]|nr:cytochrome c biogenesis protein CcsA [Phycisphaerales bacterium]MCB9835507.1 cytochrome c biogenesis protein CcsA [Phycisphaera sp.]
MSRDLIALVLAVITVACVGSARAQYAPDGNAHPETKLVDEVEGDVTGIFGTPPARSAMSPGEKHAFAQQIDAGVLESLAVFHNGRVKTIGTLAEETVFSLTGKRRYDEPGKPGDNGAPEKLKYSPVFTLFDLVIDPAYYVDKPLLAADFLPARRAFVEMAFPEDAKARERWTKLGRLSPVMAVQLGGQVYTANESNIAFRESIGRIDRRLGLYQNSINNFQMVAPGSVDDKWHHLGEWGSETEIGQATRALGSAWRSGDAAATNEAIAKLAALLPTVNAELYPTGRLSIETTYNKLHAFEWGLWLYGLALVTLMLAFGTGRKWLIMLGIATLTLAITMHGVGFVLRCIVADRFAIQNQFESMTGLSLFAAIVGGSLMLIRRQWLFGAATAGVGFLVLITATQTGVPGRDIQSEAAILNTSVLLKYHVTTVLASYGLIALGFIVSLFYLGTHYLAKARGKQGEALLAADALGIADGEPAGVQRTLADLHKAQLSVLQLAFWTLGVGTLLGAWWADHSWGRWWAFDPKETWALVTWIVYLIVIHVRFAGLKNPGLVTAWLSVIGFFIMLWTYFGVNLLLPGLHAYA